MTSQAPPPDFGTRTASLVTSARLTASLAARQFMLLFIIGTLLLAIVYFFNLYGIPALQGESFFQAGSVCIRDWLCMPAIVAAVYSYVFLVGFLFAFVPSERSFNLFFYAMLAAIVVTNYDHTVIDWVLTSVTSVQFRVPEPVSVIKLALASVLLSTVIGMHYNILADDFTKRMIRRGIPTEEASKIRPGMFKALVPLLTACCFIVVGLGIVGEFSALLFSNRGLLPKLEILILGGLGVGIAYVLRSIIKELYQGGGTEPDAEAEPTVPKTREAVPDESSTGTPPEPI